MSSDHFGCTHMYVLDIYIILFLIDVFNNFFYRKDNHLINAIYGTMTFIALLHWSNSQSEKEFDAIAFYKHKAYYGILKDDIKDGS